VQQWHLNNTGQSGGTSGEDLRVPLAWLSTRGAGVQIAVTDDGIDITHPDLAPNVLANESYNYLVANSVWPLPCTNQDNHGTAVAGVAVARDGNGIGGAGVAPRASMVAYNALSANDDASLADAMTRGKNNHIWHNSWGSPDAGSPQPAPRIWEQAIDEGIRSARSGRGAIYVFPGGNGRQKEVRNANGFVAATIEDDSNLDGYANKLGVIAVCSVDDRGVAPSYAEKGANLIVCAPGQGRNEGIVTTALLGNYRTDFSGTSASAPMVAGVAALMLEVNSALSWRDVQRILATTARQNHPGDPGWITAGGIRFNHQYGFGVADADAAVRAAKTWVSVGGSAKQKVCGPFTRSPGVQIPDSPSFSIPGSVVTDAMSTPNCGITNVEFVEVHFTSSHPYAGDLRIRLVSPNNLVSELANERACGSNVPNASNPCRVGYNDWRFGSVRHLGETLTDNQASGPWTLEVSDRGPKDVGNLTSWSLTLYGE
jgi:kexin